MRLVMKSRLEGIHAEALWEQLQRPTSFQKVTFPLMRFRPQASEGFPVRWMEGDSYRLVMYLLGVIPLGHHTIRFVKIDRERMRISTDESGMLLREWRHTMEVNQAAEEQTVRFSDTLELNNGLLTLPTYVGVYVFFVYRHWRIKSLIRRGKLT